MRAAGTLSFTLDELLTDDFDLDGALVKLAAARLASAARATRRSLDRGVGRGYEG